MTNIIDRLNGVYAFKYFTKVRYVSWEHAALRLLNCNFMRPFHFDCQIMSTTMDTYVHQFLEDAGKTSPCPIQNIIDISPWKHTQYSNNGYYRYVVFDIGGVLLIWRIDIYAGMYNNTLRYCMTSAGLSTISNTD